MSDPSFTTKIPLPRKSAPQRIVPAVRLGRIIDTPRQMDWPRSKGNRSMTPHSARRFYLFSDWKRDNVPATGMLLGEKPAMRASQQ